MRIIYKSKQTTLTPGVRIYLEDKIVRATNKLLGKNNEAAILEIEFGRTTGHHRKGMVWWAEANLALGKHMIRAEETGDDPHAVIDIVASELSREIKSFKEKNQTKNLRGARRIKRDIKERL